MNSLGKLYEHIIKYSASKFELGAIIFLLEYIPLILETTKCLTEAIYDEINTNYSIFHIIYKNENIAEYILGDRIIWIIIILFFSVLFTFIILVIYYDYENRNNIENKNIFLEIYCYFFKFYFMYFYKNIFIF